MDDNINVDPLDHIDCYFNLSEFLIHFPGNAHKPIDAPYYVINNIILYHLIPLNRVREIFGEPVLISDHSGYRPVSWEINKNRNGSSTHTFGTNALPKEPTPMMAAGASDTTVRNMSRFTEFATLLARTPYRRHIIYPEKKFVHNDYKAEKKHFLVSEGNSLRHIRFEEYLEYADQIAND